MAKKKGKKKSLLDKIRKRGIVRVTVKWGETSMQYLDPDCGEPAGFVALVSGLLARDLGVKPEFLEIPWTEQIPAIVAGEADISVKHTNSPPRAFHVEFTNLPIAREQGNFVVLRDRGLNTISDLNQPGRTIAVATGQSQELQGREYPPPAKIVHYPTSKECFEAVAAGEVDATMHDTGIPTFLLQHPEAKVLEGEDGKPAVAYYDCVHPGIKAGDAKFLNWLNNWVSFWDAGNMFAKIFDQANREHAEKVDRVIAMAKKRGAEVA